MFCIHQRRYTGSKYKLANWIIELINKYCVGSSFLEIFAGTSVIASLIAPKMKKIILNDTLESSRVIYKAFYGTGEYDIEKLEAFKLKVNDKENTSKGGYFAKNYGGTYFSLSDCRKIEYIRNLIEKEKNTPREYAILLSSLIYSMDRCANTVGHFDAYRRSGSVIDKFAFDLIQPLDLADVEVEIYNEDANRLAKKITADIVYVDPPYNSRQYCQFYHIYETIVRWDNSELFVVALKPKGRLLSDYCRSKAPHVFDDLIKNLNCRYIVVSYNNTYHSKSNSSKNKITLEEIETTLTEKGYVQQFSTSHQFFNAGKTDFPDHKELLYIVKVK